MPSGAGVGERLPEPDGVPRVAAHGEPNAGEVRGVAVVADCGDPVPGVGGDDSTPTGGSDDQTPGTADDDTSAIEAGTGSGSTRKPAPSGVL